MSTPQNFLPFDMQYLKSIFGLYFALGLVVVPTIAVLDTIRGRPKKTRFLMFLGNLHPLFFLLLMVIWPVLVAYRLLNEYPPSK